MLPQRERPEGEKTVEGWWAFEPDDPSNGDQPAVVDSSKSKRELYRQAKDAGIDGRSAMSKAQLVEALQSHHSATSSSEPATREAPPSPASRPETRRPERCSIVYRESDREGAFHVVVTATDGSQRSAARSPAFRAKVGEPRRSGAAEAAHHLLVERLVAAGWWPAGSSEEWPEIEFVRVRPAGPLSVRSLVTVARSAGRARFVVEKLDAYGNPTPLATSDPFRAPRLLPIRPSKQAQSALRELLDRMETDGWKVDEHVGDEWYAVSLWRRRDAP